MSASCAGARRLWSGSGGSPADPSVRVTPEIRRVYYVWRQIRSNLFYCNSLLVLVLERDSESYSVSYIYIDLYSVMIL